MGECKGVMGMKKMEQGGRWMGWKNGVMTVYFSLTFLLILSLLFSLMETARYYGIQMRIQCVTDMAVTSVFAEFQKELLTDVIEQAKMKGQLVSEQTDPSETVPARSPDQRHRQRH